MRSLISVYNKDNIEYAATGGVTSIIQPGGSVRDPNIIEKCKEYGINMLFTNNRVFYH